MTTHRQALAILINVAERLKEELWGLGILPMPKGIVEEMEQSMQGVLSPVKPLSRFREGLRRDLDMVAQRRMAGLIIEYPKPLHRRTALGIAASLLAAMTAMVLIIAFPRLITGRR